MFSSSDYHFRNWAGNCRFTTKNFFQPESEEELRETIRNSKKINFTGSGHSWSSICLNEDALLNLDFYNKILHLDKENLRIKVQSGIKLWQLNKFLDRHQLALSNLGSVSKQSLAGAISTGTHGSGINFQILGSQMEEFSIIQSNGEKINLHCEKNKELFRQALVNLGALGAVSEITLRVVPAFQIREQSFTANFNSIIETLDELIYETDHFKLWWFPHIEEVVVYRYSRTQECVNDSPLRQWLMDEILSVGAYRALLKIGNFNRKWRKNINNLLVNKLIAPLDRIEKSFKIFNVPKPPKHRETEWGFDVKNAKEILQEFKKMINTSKHRINFLQEIRFSKADGFALSPCFQRDTMWLGCYNADNYGWNELLGDFESFAKKHNGRPHWGKEFNIDREYLGKQYPLLQKFNCVRKEFDPEGKFENQYIKTIFGV